MGKLDRNAITILIVDDELSVRTALRAELEDAAMTVIEARNATEALRELEANMNIEAVLSDIRMPGGFDGVALARLVERRWPFVRILLTSGEHAVSDRDLPSGTRYIAKPYESRQVVATIRGMVRGYA